MANKLTTAEVFSRISQVANGEFELISEYIHSHSNVKIRHSVCGTAFEKRVHHFLKDPNCPNCTSRKKSNEEFLKEVENLVGVEYEFLEHYNTSTHKIRVIHHLCGHKYMVKPADFLSGKRCPNCAKNIPLNTETFMKRVFDLVGNEYVVVGDYINSKTKIKLKHTVCGEFIDVVPSSFLSGKRCGYCNGGIKYHTSVSFAVLVAKETEKEYSVLGNYENAKAKILMIHNECNRTFLVTPSDFVHGGTRCPHCFGKNKRTTEDFKSVVFNYVRDEYVVLSEYINNMTKVKMRHTICGYDYYVTPADFLGTKNRNGRRCPRCFKNEKKTTQEFKEEIFKIFKDEYSVIGEYQGANVPIKVMHNICGHIYNPTPSNILKGASRCPCNNETKGEERVSDYLLLNKIDFSRQFSTPDCVYKAPLRFDFAILKNSSLLALIEYDGKQHYEPIEYFGGAKALQLQKKKDQIKTNYCLKNNIPCIRIPYWELDSIDRILEDKLIEIGVLDKEHLLT